MILIDKEQTYQTLSEYYHHNGTLQHMALMEALDRVPVVDAVEVIRCQECKHFKNHTGKFREQRFRKDGICKYHNYEQVMLDGFCSNAERGNDD